MQLARQPGYVFLNAVGCPDGTRISNHQGTGVPTTSAKGSAQVRTVRETRALNMKPLGVVGDPLALLPYFAI
jgi:hypothetical protein